MALGQVGDASARREGQVLYANETGVARIESDEEGKRSVIIDGQRFSPDQFVEMLSCFEGFDLYWQLRGAADVPPEWI
jgi:hypothetical protein